MVDDVVSSKPSYPLLGFRSRGCGDDGELSDLAGRLNLSTSCSGPARGKVRIARQSCLSWVESNAEGDGKENGDNRCDEAGC